jgi:hypothetical protein
MLCVEKNVEKDEEELDRVSDADFKDEVTEDGNYSCVSGGLLPPFCIACGVIHSRHAPISSSKSWICTCLALFLAAQEPTICSSSS